MSLFLLVENGLNAAADRINLVARLNVEHLAQEFSNSRNDKLNDKLNDELSDGLKRNMFEGPNRALLFLEVRVHHFLSRLVRHCYVWFHSVVILVTCECHH